MSVYVATNRGTYQKETQDHPVILLDVIDAVPIETGMVTIEAAAMAKDYLERISSLNRNRRCRKSQSSWKQDAPVHITLRVARPDTTSSNQQLLQSALVGTEGDAIAPEMNLLHGDPVAGRGSLT